MTIETTYDANALESKSQANRMEAAQFDPCGNEIKPGDPDYVTADAQPVARSLPWFVIVNPDWYDESEGDAGYGWTGQAADKAHAINQALADCWEDNGREDYDGQPEAPPTYDPAAWKQEGFTVYEVTPDFHALAKSVIEARRLGHLIAMTQALDDLDAAVTIRDAG